MLPFPILPQPPVNVAAQPQFVNVPLNLFGQLPQQNHPNPALPNHGNQNQGQNNGSIQEDPENIELVILEEYDYDEFSLALQDSSRNIFMM